MLIVHIALTLAAQCLCMPSSSSSSSSSSSNSEAHANNMQDSPNLERLINIDITNGMPPEQRIDVDTRAAVQGDQRTVYLWTFARTDHLCLRASRGVCRISCLAWSHMKAQQLNYVCKRWLNHLAQAS